MSAEPRFFNRELSWLEFNQRVLDEAGDPSIPLLERLKFLAITASNLDEFTMVRVGSLQMLEAEGDMRPDPVGLTTTQQLKAIGERMEAFMTEQYRCLLSDLEPALTEVGMHRVQPSELTDRQAQHVERIFDQEVFPILTPLAVAVGTGNTASAAMATAIESPSRKPKVTKKKAALARSLDAIASSSEGTPVDETPPFPPLINQSISLCVRLAPIAEPSLPRFAVVPFGRNRQRFITLPADSGFSYILLEDVVGMFVSRFFPGETIEESVAFRITRNADLELKEDQASDLLSKMQEIVNARRQSDCVRLELADHASPELREFLQSAIDVSDRWVFAAPGPLDLAAFFRLCDSQGFDSLRYEPWPPKQSPQISPTESLFETISRRDVLLYHPYETFDAVVRFVEEAADDPAVPARRRRHGVAGDRQEGAGPAPHPAWTSPRPAPTPAATAEVRQSAHAGPPAVPPGPMRLRPTMSIAGDVNIVPPVRSRLPVSAMSAWIAHWHSTPNAWVDTPIRPCTAADGARPRHAPDGALGGGHPADPLGELLRGERLDRHPHLVEPVDIGRGPGAPRRGRR